MNKKKVSNCISLVIIIVICILFIYRIFIADSASNPPLLGPIMLLLGWLTINNRFIGQEYSNKKMEFVSITNLICIFLLLILVNFSSL